MGENELMKFLKDNLRIEIKDDGFNRFFHLLKISISLKEEEICSTTFGTNSAFGLNQHKDID